MPSNIDPTHPATGVAVSKAASRANWAAAKAEIEHGGFFAPAGLGAIERPIADRLIETISARDFGALGDDSGATVSEWLAGSGTRSRGAADLAELRTMTGIADLELTDTIDWAAITAAKNFARERPVYLPASVRYRLSRALVFEQGGLVGETVAAGSPTYTVRVALKGGVPASDIIVLRPLQSNRHFVFANMNIQGGTRGLYGSNVAGGHSIEQHSVFENLYFTGANAEGFFLEELQPIGCHFRRIKSENCDSHGMRFSGTNMLNGSQIENCRMVFNKGDGFLFENTHSQADTPGVTIAGTIAEYNVGAGIRIIGMKATLYTPYFELNDTDKSGQADLTLGNSPGGIPASVTCIQPHFSGVNHPGKINISGSAGPAGGPQHMVLIQPNLPGKVDTTNMRLVLIGGQSNITQGSNRPAILTDLGVALAGARSVSATAPGTSLNIPATPTGVMQVLASHSDGRVASYLLRRNGTSVTATHNGGTSFLTFSVRATDNMILAKTSSGTATVSVHGH